MKPMRPKFTFEIVTLTANRVAKMAPEFFGGWHVYSHDPSMQAREVGLHVHGNARIDEASRRAVVSSALRASRAHWPTP